MPKSFWAALPQFGVGGLVLVTLAYRLPDFLGHILDFVRKSKDAKRKHELAIHKFNIDLQTKRDKMAKRRGRARSQATPAQKERGKQ